MKISTTRFGDLEITDEHLIEFRDGMVGFSKLKRYVVVESSTVPLILWLQSVESPAVAFPVIEPWFFKRDYQPALTDADRHALSLNDGDNTKVFVVMTIPDDNALMTVNMKAPVLINLAQGKAAQVIVQDKNLLVREPAYEAFTNAVNSMSFVQSATTSTEEDLETFAPVDLRRPDQTEIRLVL